LFEKKDQVSNLKIAIGFMENKNVCPSQRFEHNNQNFYDNFLDFIIYLILLQQFSPTQNIVTGDTDTVEVKIKSNTSGFGSKIELTTTAKQFNALSFDGSNFINIAHDNRFNVNSYIINSKFFFGYLAILDMCQNWLNII
jgi:hypothetical protein